MTSSQINSAPCRLTRLPSAARNSALGSDAAHVADDRLEDHAGDARAMLGKCRFEPGRIVVGQHERVLGRAARHARRVGHAQRRSRAAGGHQQAIDVPVIVAGELDDRRRGR